MSPSILRARFGAAVVASLAVLTACRGDSTPITGLSPSGSPSFVSAGSTSADWQQCANNGRTATPCEWISSVLNAGKATYYEGENIPFRFAVHIVDMQGKTPVAPNRNTLRSVTFTYGFTKGSNGNYDFIGKFNQTEKQRANLCTADLSAVAGVFCDAQGKLSSTYDGQGSPLYEPVDAGIHEVIPIDKSKFLSSNTLPQSLKPALELALDNYLAKGGKLEIDVFGGRAGSVDEVRYNVGGGDVTATVTVRFYANQKDVLLAFGAHFARLQDWKEIGYKGGAGQSGSPFHIKVDNIDGTTVGALGNNVSGAVVLQEPAIAIAKTVSSAAVDAGDPFSWTVTLTNGGDGAAGGAQIVDPLPAIDGYTYSTTSPGCSITGGTLTCGPTTVAAGGTLTATVNATWAGPLTTSTCGAFQNTATGKATGLSDVTASASVTIRCPSVTLAKSAASPSVTAGTPISFTITVANTGQGAAKNVAVTDNLPTTPAGLSWSIVTPQAGWTLNGTTLSYSAASLAAGASSSITVTSPTTGTTCGQVNNTATATTTIGTVTGSPASASVSINCLGLTIVKRTNGANNSSAPGTFIKVGDPVAWTYEVKNTGNVALPNVAVTDDKLPASAISCPGASSPTNVIPSLAVGATVTCVASGTATAGQYGNVGTATSGTTTASDPDFYFGAAPSVAIIKKTNGSDHNQPTGPVVPVGSTVTWTYVVANAGNIALTNVTVTDDKVASTAISCPGATTPSNVIPTLAAGATITCSATGTATAGQYTNTGTAAASSVVGAPTPATDPDHYFGADPKLEILKQTNGSDNNSAPGVSITVGDAVTWTYAVKNTGNVALPNVVVTDDKIANDDVNISCPGATSPKNVIASLAIGQTVTCSASGTATAGQYANVGTATSGTTSDTDPDHYTGLAPALAVLKVADAASVSAGEAIGFTMTVTNTGQGIARSVTLTDVLPSGSGLGWTISPAVAGCSITGGTLTCTFGDLAALTGTASVHVTSPTTQASCAAYPNTATAQAGNHAETQGSATVTVECPTLAITKSPKNGTIVAGGTATFTIAVSNTGQGKAFNVALSDQLLSSLSWSVGSSTGWDSCAISAGQLLTCGKATLNAGTSATVTVSANVPTSFVLQTPQANGTALEMDGNLVVNGNGATDWANAGISCIGTLTGCALDATGSTDDSFGNGTKEDTAVPSITDGSIPPNKSDLLRFYVHTNRVAVGPSVRDFVYLAWQRVLDPQGTTNMDFEFNQSTALSSNAVTPVRTAGDILIKYDLSQGGSNLTMGFHRWVATGSCEASGQRPPCWGPLSSLAGAFQGKANEFGSVVDPLQPNAPRTLSTLTFGEASIDMQAAGIFQSGQCLSFGRAYLKSRSSDSFTAAIKDFVRPVPVSITNCQPASIPNTAAVSADNATGRSDNGSITVTVP